MKAFPLVWAIFVGLAVATSPATLLSEQYGDIKFTRKDPASADVPAALFPHYVHRMQYKCNVCHDTLFEMKAGANAIVMDAIQAGKFCGACHNGKTAFQATFDTCPRCHKS